MLAIAIRGLALILGLGLTLGGVWGSPIEEDVLIAGLALVASAVLSPSNLQRPTLLLALGMGFVCLFIRMAILLSQPLPLAELFVQLLILVVGALLLGYVGVREGKNWLRNSGWI